MSFAACWAVDTNQIWEKKKKSRRRAVPFSLNVATSIWFSVVDWTTTLWSCFFESFFCFVDVASCRWLITRMLRNKGERHWCWHCLATKQSEGRIISISTGQNTHTLFRFIRPKNYHRLIVLRKILQTKSLQSKKVSFIMKDIRNGKKIWIGSIDHSTEAFVISAVFFCFQ